MIWLRVIAGLAFLAWSVAVVVAFYRAVRPLPDPDKWKADKGQLDVHSEEYRRLILK